LGIKPAEIRLTGGGSQSPAWRQICADAFRVPVVCLATAEGAALGAALHGGWVHSLVNNKSSNLPDLVARAVKIDEKSRALPNKENADEYEQLFGRFNGLTQRLATGGYL
jgi:xylulokinase